MYRKRKESIFTGSTRGKKEELWGKRDLCHREERKRRKGESDKQEGSGASKKRGVTSELSKNTKLGK